MALLLMKATRAYGVFNDYTLTSIATIVKADVILGI